MKNTPHTLITVSLDELRPFDMDPRITRNPHYDEIKASILLRGLDHPPQITRRPDEDFYIIASGGNTRLAILNELWLETHDKKYRDILCYFREWQMEKSIDEGNLHCLLGHLIENEMRGSLTFIERALGVQSAVDIYKKIHKEWSQKDLVQMLCNEGYPISSTQLSIMSAAITFLLPYIPELLYSDLSRKNIDRLLALRSNTEKFWDNFCQNLPASTEHQLPLFDDIFSLALAPFNESAAGFSLENIQDELTGLISQTLDIDYNTVALVTDARAQKRSVILGTEPVPELPEIGKQRSVDLKYKDKPTDTPKQQTDKSGTDDPPENNVQDYPDSSSAIPMATERLPFSGCLSDSPFASTDIEDLPSRHNNPLADTPEMLASLIDQTACELAGNAGLEFLISPTETGIFDIAAPEKELSNEGKIYWQMLSFLAGKLPGSAAVWRQMLIGSPTAPAGFNEVTLKKIFQIIFYIRRLYEKQHQGEIS